MAGQLHPNSREQLASAAAGLAFKAAGVAVVAATPDGSTPRRFIKLLHAVVNTLQKHHEHLLPEAIKSLKELDHAVTEAGRTHSAAANGKLHLFLTEDRQVYRLQATAAAVEEALQSTAKLTTYVAAGFQADVNDVLSKLCAAKCSLPASQLQLIDQFKILAAGVDPTCPEVPDGIQKSAEQVVRQAINEVHGPFFNEEILDKELNHLEKAAQHLNPVQQRQEAAVVKLLASTLMQLEADEPEEDEEEELPVHMRHNDPFLIPAVPSVLRLVGRQEEQSPLPQQQEQQQNPSCSQVLAIQLAGDGSAVNTPRAQEASSHTPIQQLFGSTTAADSLAHPTAATTTTTAAAVSAVQQQEGASETPASVPGTSNFTAPAAVTGDHASNTASQNLLEDFMEGRSGNKAHTREGRRACTFQAPMRLQPEDLAKLVQFLQQSPRVRGLSLAHNWIGADGAQRLCQAMMVHRSVRSLELQDNRLGDDGAAAVAQLLHAGVKLVKLQLSKNSIGDQGALVLATAIAAATTLEKLSLHGNCIGPAGCQALTEAIKKNSSLKVVEYLPGNATTPMKDVKALAKAVKQNRKFNIFNMFATHSQ